MRLHASFVVTLALVSAVPLGAQIGSVEEGLSVTGQLAGRAGTPLRGLRSLGIPALARFYDTL